MADVPESVEVVPQRTTFRSRRPYDRRGPPNRSRAFPKRVFVPQLSQSSSILCNPILRYFPIFCSNRGLESWCDTTFAALEGRDARMAADVSVLQLKYITCTAWLYRVLSIARITGPIIPHPLLKQVGPTIQLPGVLQKYIDCLGIYKMANGTSVVPWVSNPEEFFADPDTMLHPNIFLAQAGRLIMDDEPWGVDVQWINEWNQSTTRASRQAMKFGTVAETTDGRVEMVCSYGESDAVQRFDSYAPQECSEVEVQLGASYQLRDVTEWALWPGDQSHLVRPMFRGGSYDPEAYISAHINESFLA